MKRFSILLLCVLALAASGCDAIAAIIAPQTGPDMRPTAMALPTAEAAPPESETPDFAAKRWFEAAFAADMDTLEANTCTSAQGVLQQAADSFSGIATQGVEISLSKVTYGVADDNGESARVIISGVLEITMSGQTVESPIGGVDLPMVKQDGVWKVCGF